MQKLVIASNNAGKLREIRLLLEPLGIEVLPQSAFDFPEAEEPHCTFVENALAKARHASKNTGLPALADDSGICVNILGGKPGILSARYAGEPKSDERNNQRLVEALQNQSDRRAYYYCVIALLRHPEDPRPIIADGSWHGEILLNPRGNGGFGYDPYFFLANLDKTAAELPMEQKNRISHRGKALAQLVERIRQEQP
ncbi:XTP/dITP diphosphohydrolase [Nitrosospira multiformis ATCC 25196]|uniref:dITP/XTP pyrophosphatase n=1 Tax=Nitrosospira multiformis (strain ATCC 25196 / NCIMB 11849 / C 71) TaxID=323848 RepID=Q2YCZ5_NITMU|nr:RdgB/HAM1 family non-canonical purine NTP pyrophosphatase [Nitrosospira multiformis]ABB73376.1 Ham1-like protein [Nitrosospira multiformis ATCC 25196]SEG17114.1 XTP/dITP diphosphohydrolase [Nitrosospira multiformis ATCC 25196]